MKLWYRSILKEQVKCLLFFLFIFFILYALIEYSLHMNDFFKSRQLYFKEVVFYYFGQFLKRLDFLLPMALLLSVIKCLTSLNRRNEWLVLQTAGLSSRTALRPFFVVALASSFLLYGNFEYLLPYTLNYFDHLSTMRLHRSHFDKKRKQIHFIQLEDGSKVFYQSVDLQKKRFFDVFWIKSFDDVWKMKYLLIDSVKPIGFFVDHFERNRLGCIEKMASYERVLMNEIGFRANLSLKVGFEALPKQPKQHRGISELYGSLNRFAVHERRKIFVTILLKMTTPLIPPLLVVALSPFCLVYDHQRRVFFIYGLGLFSLFALYSLFDSVFFFGEGEITIPALGMFASFIGITLFFTRRFFLKIL